MLTRRQVFGLVAVNAAALTAACSDDTQGPATERRPAQPDEAVLIYVPAGSDSIGDVEGHLRDALAGSKAGRVDGNDIGPNGSVIRLSGPDADRLFAVIESALVKAPLPEGTYVVKRYGGPGAEEQRQPLR